MAAVLPSLIAVLVVFAPAAAGAQADGRLSADDWNTKGVQYRKQGLPERALEAFRQAQALEDSPRARGQLGFVEHDLRRYSDAARHLSEALAAEADPWVTRNRPFLIEALSMSRRHVAQLVFRGGPAGAAVLVNGAKIGDLPFPGPAYVTPGALEVTVEAVGYLPWMKRITASAGAELDIPVDPVPVRRELPPGAATPTAAESGTFNVMAPLAAKSAPVDVENGRSWSNARTVGAWVIGGLTVGLLAATTVALVNSREVDCGPGVCNQLPVSRTVVLSLAGGTVLTGAGTVALLFW